MKRRIGLSCDCKKNFSKLTDSQWQFKLRGIGEELLDALVVFERKRQDRESNA